MPIPWTGIGEEKAKKKKSGEAVALRRQGRLHRARKLPDIFEKKCAETVRPGTGHLTPKAPRRVVLETKETHLTSAQHVVGGLDVGRYVSSGDSQPVSWLDLAKHMQGLSLLRLASRGPVIYPSPAVILAFRCHLYQFWVSPTIAPEISLCARRGSAPAPSRRHRLSAPRMLATQS